MGESTLSENKGEKEESPGNRNKEESLPTALQQLRSKEYLGLLVWFSICIVPLQYYVGTIGFQLEQMGDDGFYTNLFSITYAAAAVVAPLVGYLADKFSLGIAHGIATTLTAASFFILASPASLDIQVIGLVCYGVGRMLTFGMYFSNVGKRFGYTNYGTLAGLGLITSAIISLLQYPLIAWAVDGHQVPVNVACAAMLLAVLPYCFWLSRQERRYNRAPFFKHNFLNGGDDD
jgi:MFS family permease